MIIDAQRKVGEYKKSEVDNLPDISPNRYVPTVTAQGSKANLGEL